MDPDHGSHANSQTQQSEIDPRLQAAAYSSQLYSNTPPADSASSHFRLPPPPQPFQHQHHQQHHHPYGPPPTPQWTQEGFAAFYGPSDQHLAPVTQLTQHALHAYSPYPGSGVALPQAPLQMPLPDTSDSKRPRACEACRNLKVKCEPDLSGRTCKRCTKAGRSCVITVPSRKRQKKTDSKVAELERKIDALTQNLKSTKEGSGIASNDGGYDEGGAIPVNSTGSTILEQSAHHNNAQGAEIVRPFRELQRNTYSGPYESDSSLSTTLRHSVRAPYTSHNPHMRSEADHTPLRIERPPDISRTNNGDNDVVRRGILQMERAEELFVHYTQHMAPHMPIVVFSQDITADAVRKSSPLLFLAILSVASGQRQSDLQSKLRKEIMSALVDRIINGISRSLEVLQAIQVVAIWYSPELGKDSKYYQLVHMAAGMAIDLGINKKADRRRNHFSVLQHSSPMIDSESIECRRAWLGTYLLYSRYVKGCHNYSSNLRIFRIVVRTDKYLDVQCCNGYETYKYYT